MKPALLAAALLLGGVARADTVVDLPKSTVKLTLPDGWALVGKVRSPGELVVVAQFHGTTTLAVMRADVPNPDAWVADKKQAYADKVERGIKSKIPGYKRLSRKLADANGVPALDIEAKRNDGATVVVRVLLFRTYALSVSIELPSSTDISIAREVVETFAPPPKEPPKAGG